MHRDIQDTNGDKSSRIATVLLVSLCKSFQVLPIGGVALFLPVIRKDLGLSFTQGGTLSAAVVLFYALMQIPVGYLTDRFGSKRLYFIGILGTTTLSFALGLVSQYWQALAIQTLSGFFRALLFTPGLALLTGWFPPHRRATATGLHSLGTLLGNVVLDIVGPLLVVGFGWRFPFIGFALVGIVVSFAFLRFGKEPLPTGKQRKKVTMREMLPLFRHRVMWVCGIIQYVRLAVARGIEFWLPSLLVDEKGLSLPLTGLIIAVRFGLIAPSNILGGYVSDRLRNPTVVIGFSLIILAITTGLFVVVNNIIVHIFMMILGKPYIKEFPLRL